MRWICAIYALDELEVRLSRGGMNGAGDNCCPKSRSAQRKQAKADDRRLDLVCDQPSRFSNAEQIINSIDDL